VDAVDAGLLVVRVVAGVTLSLHGMQKLFGWFGGGGIGGTGAWMDAIGYRPGRVSAVMAGGTELLGGLGLAAGALTPLSAAGCVGVMVVAGFENAPQGFWSAKKGWEYNLVLAGAAVGVAVAGPGRLSVDHALSLADDLRGWWGVAALALGLALGGLRVATRRRD
jgi:putative oxidoreductase